MLRCGGIIQRSHRFQLTSFQRGICNELHVISGNNGGTKQLNKLTMELIEEKSNTIDSFLFLSPTKNQSISWQVSIEIYPFINLFIYSSIYLFYYLFIYFIG